MATPQRSTIESFTPTYPRKVHLKVKKYGERDTSGNAGMLPTNDQLLFIKTNNEIIRSYYVKLGKKFSTTSLCLWTLVVEILIIVEDR